MNYHRGYSDCVIDSFHAGHDVPAFLPCPLSVHKSGQRGWKSESEGGYSIIRAPCPTAPFRSVLRVAYATASTVQFVSGMSYMAALMLVREPVESMAYATLVTLLQV